MTKTIAIYAGSFPHPTIQYDEIHMINSSTVGNALFEFQSR